MILNWFFAFCLLGILSAGVFGISNDFLCNNSKGAEIATLISGFSMILSQLGIIVLIILEIISLW